MPHTTNWLPEKIPAIHPDVGGHMRLPSSFQGHLDKRAHHTGFEQVPGNIRRLASHVRSPNDDPAAVWHDTIATEVPRRPEDDVEPAAGAFAPHPQHLQPVV